MRSSYLLMCAALAVPSLAQAEPEANTSARNEPSPLVAFAAGHFTEAGDSRGISGQGSSAERARAHGRLSQRDFAQALPLLEHLAANGDLWAMRNLARLYTHGLGVTSDPATAISWLRRAAEAGDSESALALGTAYTRLARTPEGRSEARRWLTLAVERGDEHVRRDARSMLSVLGRQ